MKFTLLTISENSKYKLLRVILLMCIFVFCAFAFSWNFQNKIDMLNSQFIDDNAKILSKEEILALGNMRIMFKDQLGMGIDIFIDNNKNAALTIPSLKADAIFIGVNVETHEGILIVPMLVKKILGEGNRILLEEELSACLQKNSTFQCISDVSNSVLASITKQ